MTSDLFPSFLAQDSVGIYESLKTYGGVFFQLEEHLERFFESAKTAGIKIPESRQVIRERLLKAFKESGKKDAFVRLTLAGGQIFVIVSERKHPPELYRKGVRLKTTVVRRYGSNSGFPEAKSTAFLNQVLATLDPCPAGNYEILFLGADGYLAEARIGNLFMVQNRGAYGHTPLLLTPPPHGLLNGVTRRFVIKCARLGRIPVEERPLTRHDLFNAGEAFLTNTSWEILPIREVDGRKIGREIPGPLTQKLQKLFRREVEQEVKHHHGSSKARAR